MSQNSAGTIRNREAHQSSTNKLSGTIADMLVTYRVSSSDRLLGFVLDMGYDRLHLVTCDAWKVKCGGLPKNSFIIVKLNVEALGLPEDYGRPCLILARISNTTTTPISEDILITTFEIYRRHAQIDP